MWWRRLPEPPRVRFRGRAPRTGPCLIRLPRHPVLASLALDVVHTLRESLDGPVVLLGPPAVFPLAHTHLPGLTLLSADMEKPDRQELFTGMHFTAFWDLEETPPGRSWLRAIYPHLSGPHFAFHEEGTFVFRVHLPYPGRWREALALVGVPWKALITPVDAREEKSVVDFLKGRFGWRGEPLVVVEGEVTPPSGPWMTVSLDHAELVSWNVSRVRALLALARVYAGAGVMAGEALRLGLILLISESLSVEGTLPLSEESWREVRKKLHF